MQVLYPGAFVAMLAAYTLDASNASALKGWEAAGLVVFMLAKLLKYWAMATLGVRWTFRVLVPPGSTAVAAGPYRLIRHPNYVAVMGELVGVAMIARTPIVGGVMILLFGALILLRIRVEERALDAS
jgi:methyltransferase